MKILGTIEDLIAKRCKVIYEGRPHTIFLYSDAHLTWLNEPEHLRKLRKHLVGSAVIFKGLWKHGEDDHDGVYTENGIYVWRNPRTMAGIIKYLHDLDLTVYLYNAPHVWVREGRTGRQFLAEAMRLRRIHGDIHWYFDGYGWESQQATEATLHALKDRGFNLWIHGSVAPNLGSTTPGQKAEVRQPGAELATNFLWGETNQQADDFLAWYKSLAAYIDHPDVRCLYKPAKDTLLKGNPRLAAILADRFMVIERLSPQHVGTFNQFYWPLYEKSRKLWEDDPDEFVLQKVRVFE